MPRPADVIITRVPFVDNEGSKIRPAIVLFEELRYMVITRISPNLRMKGVPITKAEGAVQDSVI